MGIQARPGPRWKIAEHWRRPLKACALSFVAGVTGSRPLYMPPGGAAGRGASRGFAIVNHESQDGLAGMFTIVGGKFTTYRLMAERMADQVCEQLGNHTPCRTAENPLVPEVSMAVQQARKYFPAYGTDLGDAAGTGAFWPRYGTAG